MDHLAVDKGFMMATLTGDSLVVDRVVREENEFTGEHQCARASRHDAGLARSVCKMDDEVDRVHRLMYSAMQTVMCNDVALIESAVNTISATRHLERIGDLATNIAEDVVFMVEGEILRHNY